MCIIHPHSQSQESNWASPAPSSLYSLLETQPCQGVHKMAYALTAAAATIFALPILLLLHSLWKPSRLYPLPPGPKKLPIVENMFDIPTGACIWLKYAEMCQKYKSDIIHLSALGNSIVVLNSAKMVSDLLDNRGSIYSSRPPAIMLGELMGWGTSAVFRPNDDLWKAQRKILNQALPPTDPQKFHQKELSATHDLLRVLPYTDNVMQSLQTWAAAFIMDITYGLKGEEAEPYLPMGMAAVKSMGIGGTPGAFYVDQIPILKHIPGWFPGADFQRKARGWSDLRMNMTESIFNVTKEKVAMGIAAPSLTSFALEEMDHKQDLASQEDLIKITAVTAFSGGADTPVSVLGEFILAMLRNPEVQAKAHSELERVLGPGNLPSLNDVGSLPYITAVVRETLRYSPVTPLAFPHELIEDDIYAGYLLPKGSIVLANVWSILHNEDDYPEPHLFNPSRFLDSNGQIDPAIKDPATPVFGFGRRVCPGKHIALDLLWIAIASILTSFSIEPGSDYEDETFVKPNLKSKSSESGPTTMLSHPRPFKCRFIPRSKEKYL
ncbi:cytochrome P450 [Lentinula edodes]|uniref:Cytochrome P450 n=1 Tax=Lentinula edodes TaxID=5353 RepID=A0A1Q3EPZ9_LENED|nr:cytochrome P450 [Lentinula edodes]